MSENIQKLRTLVAKIYEAIQDVEFEIRKLREQNKEMEDAPDMGEEDIDAEDILVSNDVGLDTIKWGLVNGNLAIRQEVEAFIETLQKKYGVLPDESQELRNRHT